MPVHEGDHRARDAEGETARTGDAAGGQIGPTVPHLHGQLDERGPEVDPGLAVGERVKDRLTDLGGELLTAVRVLSGTAPSHRERGPLAEDGAEEFHRRSDDLGRVGGALHHLTDGRDPEDPPEHPSRGSRVVHFDVEVTHVVPEPAGEAGGRELTEDVPTERPLELASDGRGLERELPVPDQE